MKEPFNRIIELLRKNDIFYTIVKHEPVYTSEEAAKVRGIDQKYGAKSLLLKADGEFVLAIIPGDHKLDTKKLKNILNVKDLHFASSDEVIEKMGCEIGACYPIGSVASLPVYMDTTWLKIEKMDFNPGRHDRSIEMQTKDYIELEKPTIVEISK